MVLGRTWQGRTGIRRPCRIHPSMGESSKRKKKPGASQRGAVRFMTGVIISVGFRMVLLFLPVLSILSLLHVPVYSEIPVSYSEDTERPYMLFNSVIFLVFALVFYAVWPLLKNRANARWGWLTAASFVFYGWWDWRFLFLIIGSGLLDFFSGLGMERYPARKRWFLALSLLGNIGSLAAFKYSRFLAENVDALLAGCGIEFSVSASLPPFIMILPVGISFYTFQSMSYTIDIYRNELKPTKNILHFFSYLSMFPQLVAGPIVRARELLPQLTESRDTTEEERWEGTSLVVRGFFKKMVIADNLAPIVTAAFSSMVPAESSLYWWSITTAFAFQIYCDFSGYSDIARGLARWMGYDFLVNFNHPYVSTSLREFWTRWHISLSTWFRDYVYIPLGGSRTSELRSYTNLVITMVVSGLWHGAAWTFVIWGLLHGVFSAIERMTKWPKRLKVIPLGRYAALLIVMVQVWVAWVFFRAETLSQAVDILRIMFSFSGELRLGLGAHGAFFIALALLREATVFWRLNALDALPPVWRPRAEIAFMAVVVTICVYFRGPGSEFIYFQF